ncbi:cytidylyltransferase domain-containing protein [Chloroflexota bacterium]
MIVDIIQARIGSTRLPGKVLANISGKPTLCHVIERVKHSKSVDAVMVATTTKREDEIITKVVQDCGVVCSRGSEEDVLDRYYHAALAIKADIIVRTTADCPFIDPQVIDKVVNHYINHRDSLDYVSNVLKPTYPDGLDVEVFSINVLEKAWQEAKKPAEREHVTPYIKNHPELFRLANVENKEDLSQMRWTLDTEDDLQLIREVYARLYKKDEIFLMRDVLDLVEKNPWLTKINQGHRRDDKYWKQIATEACKED